MTISDFLALPEWEKKILFQYEQERVKTLKGILDSMVDKEKLSPEAYATIMQSLYG
jgi:hypothetical protein